jgi:hypothetical protein
LNDIEYHPGTFAWFAFNFQLTTDPGGAFTHYGEPYMFTWRSIYLLVDANAVVLYKDVAVVTGIVPEQDTYRFCLAVFANVP